MNFRCILSALPHRKRKSNDLCKLHNFRSRVLHGIGFGWMANRITKTVAFTSQSSSWCEISPSFRPKIPNIIFIKFDLVAHSCSCAMISPQIDTFPRKTLPPIWHLQSVCVRFDLHRRMLSLKMECGCTQCDNVCVRMTYLWRLRISPACELVSAQCLCSLRSVETENICRAWCDLIRFEILLVQSFGGACTAATNTHVQNKR